METLDHDMRHVSKISNFWTKLESRVMETNIIEASMYLPTIHEDQILSTQHAIPIALLDGDIQRSSTLSDSYSAIPSEQGVLVATCIILILIMVPIVVSIK